MNSNPLVRDKQLALKPTRGDRNLVNRERARWTCPRNHRVISSTTIKRGRVRHVGTAIIVLLAAAGTGRGAVLDG